jgi:hypothetical protein
MPKREDDFWASQKEGLRYCSKHKRYYREEYGCQLCQLEEAGKNQNSENSPNTLDMCPACNKPSLFWNNSIGLYECLNKKCRRNFTKDRLPYIELEFQKSQSISQESPASQHTQNRIEPDEHLGTPESSSPKSENNGSAASTNYRSTHVKSRDSSNITGTGKGFALPQIDKWLLALLFIFSLSLAGLGISLLLADFIPLWILFLFSFVYSIEKWLYYRTRKHKSVGKLYRIFLNLSIISLIWLMVLTGIELFSSQHTRSPLTGSLIFLAEFVLFVWMWRVVAKNSWRWPSMKLTAFSLVVILTVFAFAGVKPLSNYKDAIVSGISNIFSSLGDEVFHGSENTDGNNQLADTNVENGGVEEIPSIGISRSGKYMNYYLGLVNTEGGVLHGNECYGEFIVLINNVDAKNPTYSELLDFLRNDKTDEYLYQYQMPVLGFYYGDAEDKIDLIRIKGIIDGDLLPDAPKVCADFAERLHNNAEMAGIRCGYVSLDMTGYTDPNNLGIASDSGHSCNVFETTDRGLIYIDCTGVSDNYGPPNNDRIVSIVIGQPYNPVYLFPSEGWYIPSGQMGVVTNMLITWDGDWR